MEQEQTVLNEEQVPTAPTPDPTKMGPAVEAETDHEHNVRNAALRVQKKLEKQVQDLTAENEALRAQTQSYQQHPQTTQDADMVVQQDSRLNSRVDDIEYNQQRAQSVDNYIAGNQQQAHLRARVLELANSKQHKQLPTQELFAIVQSSISPEQPTPTNVPTDNVVPVEETKHNVFNSGNTKQDEINRKRLEEAQRDGVPFEPITL